MQKREAVVSGIFVVCFFLTVTPCAEDATRVDGTFEQGENGPVGWSRMDSVYDGVVCDWVEGASHRGTKAVRAASKKARPAWVSQTVPVDPGSPYVVDGWMACADGTAWLEARFIDARGETVGRRLSAPVGGISGWTYAAVEMPAGGKRKYASVSGVQIAFWVKDGAAALDDAAVRPMFAPTVVNGDFEMPLDKKGRFPYWDEEKDDSLMPGSRAGAFALNNESPAQGAGCLALTATGDWYAFSPVRCAVWEWSDFVEVSAAVRCAPGAVARLLVVWTDAADNVVGTAAGKTVKGDQWQCARAGPCRPPAGAQGMRTVLVVLKKDGASAPESTAWFDSVAVRVQDKPFIRVTVNQVGYEMSGPKSAVVLTNFPPAKEPVGTFEIMTENGDKVMGSALACAGRMYGEKQADWGWYFWRADFSAFDQEGRYRVQATVGNQRAVSQAFTVGRDVLFCETAAANVDFFYVQRCGIEVPGWHAACHLDDARLKDGTHLDLTGGWHSAGDYNKLNWEYGDGGVMYALINASEAAPEWFSRFDRDKDRLSDILDEAWWGAKYLAKVQIPDTGGVLNHIEQGPDRKTWMNWCPPEKTTDNVVGTADDPVVTEGEGSSPLAIGGWARLAAILNAQGVTTDYQARAVQLWEHATANGSALGQPLLLISSVDLYLATGEPRYLDYCRRSVEALLASGDPEGRLTGGYGDTGDIPAAALAHFALRLPQDPLAARIKDRLQKHLPHFLAEAENPLGLMMQKPGTDGYFFDPSSALGCNYQLCCRAWSALMIYRVTEDPRAWEYAANQLDFVLGKNPYSVCMMEGEGTVNLPRYHHRYITIPGHERGAVPGAIPNGFVRDMEGNDRPGMDLSTGGRPYPSYRTNEPWLVHNVFYTLAVTALHEAQQ